MSVNASKNKSNYHLTNETFPFEFNDFVKQLGKHTSSNKYVDTPNRGFYNRMKFSSNV